MRALDRRPGSRAAAVLVALAGLALAGCLHDPTEIVLVVDSDLTPGVDFEAISFEISTPRSRLPPMKVCGVSFGPTASVLPATLGVTPVDAGSTEFEVVVKANGTMVGPDGCVAPVVRRTFSNVRFVADEMKVLFIPILRQCECEGTTCAHALDPDCRDVTQPVLADFDEDHIPRLSSVATTP